MTRLALLATLIALLVPTVAAAAPRMPIGFQDDPSFRWGGNTNAELDRAQTANASIIRTTVDWRAVAPTRPGNAANSDDPAYKLNDLDELVRNAAAHGMEVMLTIWGTPKWANGGLSPNHLPTRPSDLTTFAKAIAGRYDGTHSGIPYVGRYSIWNESNLDLFLTPQYSPGGKIVSPALYAKLYRAGYAGIKAGNPRALVAIGETSARGRDRVLKGVSGSVSPGMFAQLLAAVRPAVKFDAWAQHPYPTSQNLPPTQKVKWPNVTLTSLPRFETSLDTWFHRSATPIWITEYGHETKPAEPHGVSLSKQAAYARQALQIAARDSRVQMFIWFILRDNRESLWQSGLFSYSGAAKPAFGAFSATARLLDGLAIPVKAGRPDPVVRIPLPRIAYFSTPGTVVGVTYRLFDGKRPLGVEQPALRLGSDAAIELPLSFVPAKGHTYYLNVVATDANGNAVTRDAVLTA